MMEFTTNLIGSEISIHNLRDGYPDLIPVEWESGSDYDIEDADFQIKWEVEIEAREWGIKSIIWFIRDIQGSFKIVRYDEKGDESGHEVINFNWDEFERSAILDLELGEYKQLDIETLEIDFKTKTVRAS